MVLQVIWLSGSILLFRAERRRTFYPFTVYDLTWRDFTLREAEGDFLRTFTGRIEIFYKKYNSR